jgi:uncharacterized protein (TIGR02391 family)
MSDLSSDGLRALEAIWKAFGEDGAWPTFGRLDRALDKIGIDAEVTLRALSPRFVRGIGRSVETANGTNISLSLVGLNAVDAASALRRDLVSILQHLVATEQGFDPEPGGSDAVLISAHDVLQSLIAAQPVRSRSVLEAQVRLAGPVIQEMGSVWTVFAPGEGGEWSLTLSRTIRRFRGIASFEDILRIHNLMTSESSGSQYLAGTDYEHGTSVGAGPTSFTTEASVTANKIHIEIHEDIYDHIGQYLATGDYFHAVEESYKLVREKLKDITGSERATDAFASSNVVTIFGRQPTNEAEKDFFEGVKFLNMSIQFLRNEKAHTPATPLEPNLAIHYISLASLAYDLITRYVSEDTIKEIEDLVVLKRRGYRSASAFYRDFENGRWLATLNLPAHFESSSVRRVLKRRWLQNADFTRSWDHSNVVLMRLELVAAELTSSEIDKLLDLPTLDSYGNDQEAGMLPFLEFIEQTYPDALSLKAKNWIAATDS